MNSQSSGMQPAKVAIISIMITTLASVAVAFIGVFPELRENDKTEIHKLQVQLDEMSNMLKAQSSAVPVEKCSVGGKISKSDSTPLSNAEVYLIRASGSEYMATTGDAGGFTFQGVEDVPYWIVVRHSESKTSARTLIYSDPKTGKIKIPEVVVEYERH